MKPFIATALIGAALALSAAAQQPDKLPPDVKAKLDSNPLEGGYTIVSAERNGKPIANVETKEIFIRFTRNEMVGTGKDQKNLYGAGYTLDTKTTPWKIDIKTVPSEKLFFTKVDSKESVTLSGIVKTEGATITIVFALPGGKVPTEFKTEENQQMFVLKKYAGDTVKPNKFPEEP